MEILITVIGIIITLVVLVIVVRAHGVFFLRAVKKLEQLKTEGKLTEKIYNRYANIYSGLKKENMMVHFFGEDDEETEDGKN